MSEYYYADGLLAYEKRGDDKEFYYSYDSDGNLAGIRYILNGVSTAYYPAINSRGDVEAIYDANGVLQAKYIYDSWGNVLRIEDALGNEITDETTIGHLNPIRYRGYYYDAETGFYYLGSRYYDPEVGRFISADGAISGVGGDIRGYNLYSYCFNNPVNMNDPDGNWPKWVQKIGNAVKNVVNTVVKKVKSVASSVKKSITKTNLAKANSLPPKGDPGSSQTLKNPDGTPKQRRWYGPDGKPERDRDYNHPGNMPFPHDHVWDNGKRGKEHLPPSPDYAFSLDPLVGTALVGVCTVGIVAVALDDLTGIGVADNGLMVPLSAGVGKGLVMLFP